jgi:N6-adenosine-specific RNA methylase IME4/ParB-like chromosome segregation protein Spo0J
MSGPGRSTVAIAAIKLGERHRRDMGDVAALAESIRTVGLLHPPVVRSDGALIAGARRIAACRLLGWKDVPVRVVHLEHIVRGEFAENAHRKDFLPSEIASIMQELEPVEKAAARARMSQGAKGVENFHTLPGKARDKVATFAGISGRTLDKIKAVTEAAEAEPERFGKLKDAMDRTGRVNGPHKRLQVALKADAIKREPPPLPGNGPYRVIVADPPWPYEKRQEDPSHRGVYPYPAMSIAQICALEVAAIAHADSILWLWTTNHHMREAFAVLDAWGFQQKQILTWVKHKMGAGDWLRGQTEHCLMATCGKPVVTLTNQTTALHAPVRAHSQKPEEFYALVESLCPAPRYCELFSRQQRERWDGHGDEATGAAA